MFCKNCGKELNNGAKVCPNCGTKVSSPISIISIFNCKGNFWDSEMNTSDCCSSHIPEDIKGMMRQNFGINYNEKILFIRDTSFWNSRDQGLVLTDGGVYCIPDNDKPDEKIVLPWSVIQRVEYKDLVLYFWGYGDETDYCPIHISYFMKNEDNEKARSIGNSLARLFTQMAQCVEPEADPFNEAAEHYDQLITENKKEEAFQFAQSCKDREGLELFYMPVVKEYIIKGEYEKGISVSDEGLKKCDNDSPMAYMLYYAKYSAYDKLGNYTEARKLALSVSEGAAEDLCYPTSTIQIKEEASSDFKNYDQQYVSSYLEQPYNKRKVLLPVNKYTDLYQDYLSVIDIKELPNSGIVFPVGHPVACQLYVGHPYIKQKYLPFENYELELIEDKVREFCQLVQCLGAKEIHIECLNSSSSDRNTDTNQHISGEANYRFASASANNERSQSKHLIDEISQSINLHQTFIPNGQPHLPENLVWYPNEPSWQRLYHQRMQGSLLQHEERIETRKSRVLEGSELNSIEGEFKNLLLAANGKWSKKIEEKFELQENAVLAIHVQFASLEELTSAPSAATSTSSHTSEEKEYLSELQICLQENGEIPAGERRLLERLRKHLQISEERALELENSLKPSLNENEKEYWNEYKLCLEDGEEISAGERRLLDKLRIRLQISEERAKEIEKMTNR